MEDYTAGLKCAMGPLCERVSMLGKLLQRPPRVRGREGREVIDLFAPSLGECTLYFVYTYIHTCTYIHTHTYAVAVSHYQSIHCVSSGASQLAIA